METFENIYISKDSSFMMSGETLEDYFRHPDLDEIRRNFLESIKEEKQEINGNEDYKNHNKNGNRKDYSQISRQLHHLISNKPTTTIQLILTEKSISMTFSCHISAFREFV